MGFPDFPTPVFIHTNLGTRFAAPLSLDTTAIDFKRELEAIHLNCFPEFGSIKVNSLMVKQRSHFYHLSESLPLQYAFLGLNGTQFLQMDVDLRSTLVHNLSSIVNAVTEKRSKLKRKKVKTPVLKRKQEIGRQENGPEKKYFSDYGEVASSRRRLNSSIECKRMNIQSPEEASRKKHVKPEVGNRLLLASESLGLSPSNQRPVLSLCRYNYGKSPFRNSTATVGNLVFEMTEESE
ncbi:hypothetical protein OROMI_008149 [Orobanche minor]